MPDPLTLTLIAWATWRLSHMVSTEFGPGHIFPKLWLLVGARPDMTGLHWSGNTFLGELILCPLCLSVWLAGILLAATVLWPPFIWVVVVLALSGVSSFLELWLKRG